MLEHIAVGTNALEEYRAFTRNGVVDEIYEFASDLRGARVAHINATANGGGVAEILRSLVPLYNDLGIETAWRVMEGSDPFFDVTKRMHNAMQGAKNGFTQKDWDIFLSCNRENARALSDGEYDVVFIHDPQPAAIRQFAQGTAKHWVWRSHIDTSTPNPETWRFVSDMVNGYDAAVFSLPDFVGPGIGVSDVAIIPPAIDPRAPKNVRMTVKQSAEVVAAHGVDPGRPFISQISRFDPWKDPLGVIAVFEEVKRSHPELQLVLLGNFADDDPEGVVMYEKVVAAASDVADVHIITGLTDMVSPFQSMSRVVLQKSLREGFGLTVTEALWKGTPVVAGNVGGIRLQVMDGIGGFRVDSIAECAVKVNYLLSNEGDRVALGESGRQNVRSNFLLPRLLRDELTLIRRLVNR